MIRKILGGLLTAVAVFVPLMFGVSVGTMLVASVGFCGGIWGLNEGDE